MAKNGLHLLTPTTVDHTGTSATINANGSVTFTACSLWRLNGVFSSSYDNYLIVCRQSATIDVSNRIRFSSGGVDDSTSNSYVHQYLFADSTSVSGARTTTNYGVVGARGNTQRAGWVATIYGPHLAQPTAFRSVMADDYSNATVTDFAGTHNQSTSYDGFSLQSGNAAYTFTGLIAVYGMRK